jgi:hypothetical protein
VATTISGRTNCNVNGRATKKTVPQRSPFSILVYLRRNELNSGRGGGFMARISDTYVRHGRRFLQELEGKKHRNKGKIKWEIETERAKRNKGKMREKKGKL